MAFAYIPSLVLNFTLKFDDSLSITVNDAISTTQDGLAKPGSVTPAQTSQPLTVQKGGSSFSSVLWRVPKAGMIEKPGYRQAGKFQFTIDWTDLPIDPRAVAAASVEIHIGTVSADDFARGMSQRESNGSRLSVLKALINNGTTNPETMRMLGFIDEWEVHHTDTGSEVTISGRDMRGVLLDTPINSDPKIATQVVAQLDLSQPIHKVVAQILSIQGFFAQTTIICNAADWPNSEIPAPNALEQVPRHRKGAKGKRKSGRGTPNASSVGALSFWDLIVRVCYFVGAIPYFNNLGQLVIRNGSTVYDKLSGPVDPVRNPTPFKNGAVRGVDAGSGGTIMSPPLKTRRLVYGRDIRESSVMRKFAGLAKPKVVRAYCYNPDAAKQGGEIVFGLWPPQEQRKRRTKESSGKGPAMEEIVNVRIPGIVDAVRLAEIAKSIFEEIGRGEMTGSITTENLSSFGGDNADPDLLRLEPGDGIEVLVDTRSVRSGSPLVSSITDFYRQSFAEQVAAVNRSVGNENLARAIVATARGNINELQRYFLTQTVKYTWREDGLTIAFDFINYIVARWSENTEIVNVSDDHVITGTLTATQRKRTRAAAINITDDHVISASPATSISISDDHVIAATPSPLRRP